MIKLEINTVRSRKLPKMREFPHFQATYESKEIILRVILKCCKTDEENLKYRIL